MLVTSILTSNWVDANQHYLSVALALVRNALKRYIADQYNLMEAEDQEQDLQQELDELASSMPVPAALTELCKTFGLSPFERDVLLLCAGVEFDGEFAALCVEASAGKRQVPSSPGLASPTF